MSAEAFTDPVSRFLSLARATPHAPVCTWIDDHGSEAETLTFAGLAADAGSIAAALLGRGGLSAGDRVLIVMQPGLDFVRAFCGCLRARLIPVPAYPHAGPELGRLLRIAMNAGTRAVLTDAGLLRAASDLPAAAGGLRAVPWYDAAALAAGRAVPPAWQPAAAADLAFLQYTSGSTAEPKGVRITHGNLAHQLECNRRELGLGPDARAVLWVPQYHDLGLISGLTSALVGNGRLYQMSPLSFVRRPTLWLEAVSRVRATHIAAPNFAFGLVLRKTTPEEIGRLSLGSLRVVMTAAEPINPRLMRAFFGAFGRAGLRPDTLCGAYGLAEHTVGVSVGGRQALSLDEEAFARREVRVASSESKVEIASCGRPSHRVRVRVVDPESLLPLGEDRVGEIWVDSPSKADGYHGEPEATAATFRGRIRDEADDREYLRTGDLGFLHDGELFVTGRLKDLMIFRGRNVYPTDVELTAEAAHLAIRPRGVAAFAVPGAAGEESLVVVAEVEEATPAAEADAALAAVATAVSRRHGQPCGSVVLVKPGTIPRTTSGKLRRRECRQAFLDGRLNRPPALVRMTPAASTAVPLAAPGLETLDDSMRRLFARFVNILPATAHGQKRVLPAVTVRGTLRTLASTAVPPHRFFSRDATYPVLLRHTNTNHADDDAIITGRGAAVRVLDPEQPDDLHRSLLDLLLMTGRRGLVRDAAGYVKWFGGDRTQRGELAARFPSVRQYFLDFWRDPQSFAEVHYHSQATVHYIAADGGRHFARYRLAEATQALDTGHHPVEGEAYLAGHIERRPDDPRPPDYLRQEFARRLAAGPVVYRLAVQVLPEPADPGEREALLDATAEWDSPWVDVAELTLDTPVAPDVSTPVSFTPGNAPADLGVVLARDANDPASVLHLRSLVYDLSGRLRRGERLPAEYEALAWKQPAAGAAGKRRVCVIGGGPAGLTAAWELEKLGHEVTVFERGTAVGGMAAGVTLDGRPYDLGAHLCTGSYETVADLARALSVETEPTTGYFLYDLGRRRVVPQDHSVFGREAFERYQQCRRSFPEIDRPGLAHSAAVLGTPVREWLDRHGLAPLAASMGPNYTAAGYGYLDDPDLGAVYLLKFSEMIGALSPRRRLSGSWTFTIRGGFQALWQRLAGELRDVRCGVAVDAVERTEREVVVKSGPHRWTFDEVVVAIPPREALAILDTDPEERELLSATRTFEYVTTVCRAERLPQLGLYLLKENCEDRGRLGHSLAFHHRYAGSDVYLFYAYGDGKSDAELDAALDEDIAALGGELKETVLRRRFRYLPHPTADAIRAGFFTRLEARQGKRRTYYTGSVLGFELVECVAAHATATVRAHFGAKPRPAPEPAAPATPADDRFGAGAVEHWLGREIAAELGLKEPLPPDAELARYGIDSVTAAAILGGLSQWLGWSVPPYMVFDQPTIAAIAQAIAGATPAPVTAAAPAAPRLASRLIALNAPEPPPPVYLVGGLMGAALYLRELADSFPRHQPVFAFQAAGLDGTEPPFGTVNAAADAYLAAIRAARPRGPYRLAGHSFGGLVTHAMAARLHQLGEAVQLVLLDTILFPEGEPAEPPDESVALAELLVAIRIHQRPDVVPDVAAIARLPHAQLRDAVIAAVAGSRPFAGEVPLGRWVSVYRANSEAMRAFRPRPIPGLAWTLLKAEGGYPRDLMHPSRTRLACYDTPHLGWERQGGAPRVVTVPGNHYTMVYGENAVAMACAMRRCLGDREPRLEAPAACGDSGDRDAVSCGRGAEAD